MTLDRLESVNKQCNTQPLC